MNRCASNMIGNESKPRVWFTNSAVMEQNLIPRNNRKNFERTYDYSDVNNMKWCIIYNNHLTGNSGINQKQLDNLDRLYNISLLEDGWNGYGSKKINEISIEVSKNIIKNISFQPIIYPTGRDSIQMQFELKDRSYLEFEIFQEKITCMVVPKRVYAKASFKKLKITDVYLISRIVKEFYGRECTKE